MSQSKKNKAEWVLWPNGKAYKGLVFPILMILAFFVLQAYLTRFPSQVVVVLVALLGIPLIIFLLGHRIVLRHLEIQGPAIGSLFGKAVVARRDAVFTDQKIWGLSAFIIRDRKTNAEISAFYIYFSRQSINRLKALVGGK